MKEEDEEEQEEEHEDEEQLCPSFDPPPHTISCSPHPLAHFFLQISLKFALTPLPVLSLSSPFPPPSIPPTLALALPAYIPPSFPPVVSSLSRGGVCVPLGRSTSDRCADTFA